MKNTFILLILLCCSIAGTKAFGQEAVCSIRYSYDKNGSRTRREYKCEVPPGPGTPAPWTDYGPVVRNIYPVPTPGGFTVEFGTVVASAYLYVVDINGIMVQDRTVSQQSSLVNFDLTPFSPGNYILVCLSGNAMESYAITRL